MECIKWKRKNPAKKKREIKQENAVILRKKTLGSKSDSRKLQ